MISRLSEPPVTERRGGGEKSFPTPPPMPLASSTSSTSSPRSSRTTRLPFRPKPLSSSCRKIARTSSVPATLAALVFSLSWLTPLDSRAASPEAEALRLRLTDGATRLVDEVLGLHCPDRCSLLGVRVEVDEGALIAHVQPGFEELAPTVREVRGRRVEATILLDARLPADFRRDVTGLVQARLRTLDVPAVVRTELASFPRPLPPEVFPEEIDPYPNPHSRLPPPEPLAEGEREPFDPKTAFLTRLIDASPWLVGIVLTGLLLLLIAGVLRGDRDWESGPSSLSGTSPNPETPDSRRALAAGSKQPAIPLSLLLQRLGSQLSDSPRVRMAVMRDLLLSGELERFASLVRLLGASIADGLRDDPHCRPVLRQVGQLLRTGNETELDEERSRELLLELESRIAGARLELLDDPVEKHFSFLDRLTPNQLRRLLDESSPRSQAALLRFAPPHLRDAVLDDLDAIRRRQLFLTAAETGVGDSQELVEIADELRLRATRLGPGAGADDVEFLVELFESRTEEEQNALLDSLAAKPALRDALLSRTCTEATLAAAPDEVLAAVVTSVHPSTLVDYLRGASPEVRRRMLEVSSRAVTESLRDELSLAVESNTVRFESGRREVLRVARAEIVGRGLSLEALNATANRRAVG